MQVSTEGKMEKMPVKKIEVSMILTAALLIYFVAGISSFKTAFYKGLSAPEDFAQDYIGARQLISGKSVYPTNFSEVNKFKMIKQRTIDQ